LGKKLYLIESTCKRNHENDVGDKGFEPLPYNKSVKSENPKNLCAAQIFQLSSTQTNKHHPQQHTTSILSSTTTHNKHPVIHNNTQQASCHPQQQHIL